MNKLRVLLADDHALVRGGIRALLENLPRVEVVGEAGDGIEALRMIEQDSPDIAVIDVEMPRLNGLDATARIAKEFPAVKVLILSMHRGEEMVTHALRAGASGYIIKDAATCELETAIRAVASGKSYLSPAVSPIGIKSSAGADDQQRWREELTPRQREVLKLIADGQNTKEIAFTLAISAKTVEAHRAQLMERLGIHDVAGLVRYAMRTGLAKPEPFQGVDKEFPFL